jgi:DNA repair photolyase
MRQRFPTFHEAIALVQRVNPKYRSVWDGRSVEEQAALAMYFFSHGSQKPNLTPARPRIIKWYCPFASQSEFPSGHRYCINVYTGCSHQCLYCYAASYEPESPACKGNFESLIQRDIENLERFNVPPAPVHLSNSTDPFQPLEAISGHTRFALEQILAHRHRFTTVTILTKNPLFPARNGYLDLFKKLGKLSKSHPSYERFRQTNTPLFQIEVSLAFWREEARSVYDPGAPTIDDRKLGIREIRDAGIPITLRIDPLFPRSPLREGPRKMLADFGLIEPQTADDLEGLVAFARETEAQHVVYSPAKIVRKLSATMRAMKSAYECIAFPDGLRFHAGSWRLPDSIAKARVIQPFLDICNRMQVRAKHCMQNLIETP